MAISQATQQAWPPFVLVAGLLLIGLVADTDGLFRWAGSALERLPGSPTVLLCGAIVLVTIVTAVLNLDTAIVFLTPVLVLGARSRGLDERPFLYGAIYLANASSLYLPGSNLTNLLVLAHHPISGGTFAAGMVAPALAATVATAVGLILLYRKALHAPGHRGAPAVAWPGWSSNGVLAVTAAAGLTLATPRPALPIFAVGIIAIATERVRERINLVQAIKAVGLGMLVLLFFASVALGALARAWDGPAHLLAGSGRWETAAIGALGAVTMNNLPASVLLSAHAPPHPRALLIGLNIGPNFAVSGSLAAYLWIRVARQIGARPSIADFSRRGIVLAPLAMFAALLAATLLSTPS